MDEWMSYIEMDDSISSKIDVSADKQGEAQAERCLASRFYFSPIIKATLTQ